MSFFTRMLEQSLHQLRRLTISQRLTVLLSVALMVVALVWLAQWAGRPALEPLPLTDLTPEQIARIQAALEGWGVAYEIREGRVYVPSGRRRYWLARLKEIDALPEDYSLGFAELLERESPWQSEADKQRLWALALSNELSRTIRKMSGVKHAVVRVDGTWKRGFGGRVINPSASVAVTMEGGRPLDRRMVEMLASFVAGAVAGLEPEHVYVQDVNAGRAYRGGRERTVAPTDLVEIRRSEELHYQRKIESYLSYIPNVLVSVYVEQVTEEKQSQRTRLDKPDVSRETTSETRQERRPVAGEPGARPNTGVSLEAVAEVETMTTEESETEFSTQRGSEITTVRNTPGVVQRLAATVAVPRSWIMTLFKQERGEDVEPKPADLEALEQRELGKIRQAVARIINAESEEQVVVSSYADIAPEMLATTQVADAGGGFGDLARQYGSQAGLVLLACVSLVMMGLMVRRSGSSPALPPLGRAGGAPTRSVQEAEPLSVGMAPAGQAQQAGSFLEAQELPPEMVRTHQILSQLTEMIEEDPSAAVETIRQWVESDEG